MHTDFSAQARSARGMIPVPDPPIGAMRERARRASAHDRIRSLAAGGAICLAALGVGAGAGGKIYESAYVWLTGGRAATLRHSFVEVREPTVADVRDIVRRAAFPIVFPAGIPSGSRVTSLLYFPHDRPDFVQVQYYNKSRGLDFGVSLYGPSAINTDSRVPASRVYREDVYRWQVGAEHIVVPKAHVSAREAAQIEVATMKASPMSSLVETEKMLRTIENVSGNPEIAGLAERYAPAGGGSVLLGPLQLRSVPNLASTGKPMIYSRRTEFGSDMHVVESRNTEVVLSASAVKGVNAVLRVANVRDAFVLYNQPKVGVYWVWVIHANASQGSVRKYSVDANTLLVTRSV